MTIYGLVRVAVLAAAAVAGTAWAVEPEERTCFQVLAPYSGRIHIGADVAIVYGIDASVAGRIKGWKEKGYRVHVMTGVAWGEYQDYLFGQYDGTNHEDEAQTTRRGERIGHGKDVYYMSPGAAYGKYLCVGVKRAIDAGAEAIHLEEPEFWVRGGWEPNFKREWKAYYNEEWVAPDSSPEAQWRASKLKYYLYRRALADVFAFVRDYSREIGRDVKCYVPTHSLINYAHWGIVSPESSLIDVGCDGYVAQVWTGTARTPNVYEGVKAQRTFETAFLEYGAMQNLVRASGRRVWYLNDPIEDNPDHSWDDYRTNWESTLVASLLWPEVWRYEVMPWPDRIFKGKYPSREGGKERVGIPAAYATELQAVIRAMGDMKQDDVRWEVCGTRGVGVLISDSMMFQRAGPGASDGDLSSFYGLAMPLVRAGVPVEPVQMESIAGGQGAQAGGRGGDEFLAAYRLLLLTYEGQKPLSPGVNDGIARWVREGGALVVVDDDGDAYNKVKEWWNTGGQSYGTPREHLFEALGVARDFVGTTRVGRGVVVRVNESPARLARDKDGAGKVRQWCEAAGRDVGLAWQEAGGLVLRRGPYVVAAGIGGKARLDGRYVDLFSEGLPVVVNPEVGEGGRRLLVDLTRGGETPRVVAAAGRVIEQRVEGRRMVVRVEGIEDTAGAMRLSLPGRPSRVTVDGEAADATWDAEVAGVVFPNRPAGRLIELEW
jgi:hypothetical protein